MTFIFYLQYFLKNVREVREAEVKNRGLTGSEIGVLSIQYVSRVYVSNLFFLSDFGIQNWEQKKEDTHTYSHKKEKQWRFQI